MDYISVKEASAHWRIDTSNIGKLCRKGKLDGAKIVGRSWLIPKNSAKSIDGRIKAKENENAAEESTFLRLSGCFARPVFEERVFGN